MIEHINLERFIQRFSDYGRQNQFTRDGLKALFEYYEEMEEVWSEPYVLDVMGLCCTWAEYSSMDEAIEAYSVEDYNALFDKYKVLMVDQGGVIVSENE